MSNMHQKAKDDLKDVACPYCNCKEKDLNPETFETSCRECGMTLENHFTFTHISAKGASGELEKQGVVTNMRNQSKLNYDPDAPSSLCNNNSLKLRSKMKKRIQDITTNLYDHKDIPDAIDSALNYWDLCYRKGLTRGHPRNSLAAILFYIACRKMEPPLPFLLVDFSKILEENVFKLAKIFYRLCQSIPVEIGVNDDPTFFIQRYVSNLEFGDYSDKVCYAAIKLVRQMKEDWITTGRRPSGIYGAAILIAARMYGQKRSIKEIVNVVQLSEGTIKKRINEFTDTRVATMRVGDFIQTEQDEIVKNNEKGEKPPIIKKQEKFIKKQEEKLLKKKSKKRKRNDENDSDNDNDSEDSDIIDFLMKPEPTSEDIEIKKSQSQKASNKNQVTIEETSDDEDDDIYHRKKRRKKRKVVNNDNHSNDNDNDDFQFDEEKLKQLANDAEEQVCKFNEELGIESDNSFNNNNYHNISSSATEQDSYIFGAHTRNLKSEDYDDEDLSYLDEDDEIQSMVLTNSNEVRAKEMFWHALNPDYKTFKRQSDLRAKAKEELEERKLNRKRTLLDTYKDDPDKYMEYKVAKKFRSGKLNIDAFHKLLGQTDSSPPIPIKKQDPLG